MSEGFEPGNHAAMIPEPMVSSSTESAGAHHHHESHGSNVMADMTFGSPSKRSKSSLKMSKLIECDFSIRSDRLSSVLNSMNDSLAEVRSTNARARRDIDGLVSQMQNVPTLESLRKLRQSTSSGMDAEVQERFASYDSRIRNIDNRLAKFMSPAAIQERKRESERIEKLSVRMQVLERVSSASIMNQQKLQQQQQQQQQQQNVGGSSTADPTYAASLEYESKQTAEKNRLLELQRQMERDMMEEEARKQKFAEEAAASLVQSASARAQTARAGTGDDNDASNRNAASNMSTTAATAAANQDSGAANFILSSQVEQLEVTVRRLRAQNNEFQYRINEEIHEKARELHDLKLELKQEREELHELQKSMMRHHQELNDQMKKQVEHVAMEALKEWQKQMRSIDDEHAENRYRAVQNQIKELQYNLDEEQENMRKEHVLQALADEKKEMRPSNGDEVDANIEDSLSNMDDNDMQLALSPASKHELKQMELRMKETMSRKDNEIERNHNMCAELQLDIAALRDKLSEMKESFDDFMDQDGGDDGGDDDDDDGSLMRDGREVPAIDEDQLSDDDNVNEEMDEENVIDNEAGMASTIEEIDGEASEGAGEVARGNTSDKESDIVDVESFQLKGTEEGIIDSMDSVNATHVDDIAEDEEDDNESVVMERILNQADALGKNEDSVAAPRLSEEVKVKPSRATETIGMAQDPEVMGRIEKERKAREKEHKSTKKLLLKIRVLMSRQQAKVDKQSVEGTRLASQFMKLQQQVQQQFQNFQQQQQQQQHLQEVYREQQQRMLSDTTSTATGAKPSTPPGTDVAESSTRPSLDKSMSVPPSMAMSLAQPPQPSTLSPSMLSVPQVSFALPSMPSKDALDEQIIADTSASWRNYIENELSSMRNDISTKVDFEGVQTIVSMKLGSKQLTPQTKENETEQARTSTSVNMQGETKLSQASVDIIKMQLMNQLRGEIASSEVLKRLQQQMQFTRQSLARLEDSLERTDNGADDADIEIMEAHETPRRPDTHEPHQSKHKFFDSNSALVGSSSPETPQLKDIDNTNNVAKNAEKTHKRNMPSEENTIGSGKHELTRANQHESRVETSPRNPPAESRGRKDGGNWRAVRVFTKMNDPAATAALNKKIQQTNNDVKRLWKHMKAFEEEMDTLRGSNYAIREQIQAVEQLYASVMENKSQEALIDKTFVRTLRARLQIINNELEEKATLKDLKKKANSSDLERVMSYTRQMIEKQSMSLLAHNDSRAMNAKVEDSGISTSAASSSLAAGKDKNFSSLKNVAEYGSQINQMAHKDVKESNNKTAATAPTETKRRLRPIRSPRNKRSITSRTSRNKEENSLLLTSSLNSARL